MMYLCAVVFTDMDYFSFASKFLGIIGIIVLVILLMAAYMGGIKLLTFINNWEPRKRNENGNKAKTMEPEITAEEPEAADEAPETEIPLENRMFRRFADGRPVSMKKLYDWIDSEFRPQLTYKYDWFALWRVLRDNDMFDKDQDQAQTFADQMNEWFPHALKPCTAGEINRFKRGYLGRTPHSAWDKNNFRLSQADKQTMDGYNRLDSLCSSLKETFDKNRLKE